MSSFEAVNYCDGSTDWCLDVRFTPKCFAACNFCIAAEDMKNDRGFDPEAMLASVKATPQISGLSIIGGEPLLFMGPLLDFMERVELEAPHVTAMYLTTALPPNVERQRELFSKIMSKTEILNVSLQHYEAERNNLLLQTKSKTDRIALLASILEEPGMKDKIRVHLNLVKKGIDSADELYRALYRLREIGITEVKVNELMNAPEDYVSFEEITGMTLPTPYAHGCSTVMDDFFPGMKINLKRSCFVVEPSREAGTRDLLKIMWKDEMGFLEKDPTVPRVLYEDGTLTSQWQGEPLV